MTKKDYELIAKTLNGSLLMYGHATDSYFEQFQVTVRHMAKALEQSNPRFNKTKFYDACGIKEARGE